MQSDFFWDIYLSNMSGFYFEVLEDQFIRLFVYVSKRVVSLSGMPAKVGNYEQ